MTCCLGASTVREVHTELNRVQATADARGAKSLGVGMSRPSYFTPGVDPRYTVAAAFFLRRGFVKGGEAFNMDVDLSASDWDTTELEERLARNGYTVRRLRPDEKNRLREWMTSNGYSAGWQYQVLRGAEMDPVAVFIAEQDGEIVAFAGYDGVRPGWFGPMGTRENLRGGGIGSATFLKCLQSMKEVGYKVCEINSVGPLYFYSKVANAKVSRLFWQFSKQLRDA
jgi:GNAT superfamily N-acetyltransferase